jgi:hypothetical protein
MVLNELCFWTLSIVWCLKNKHNWGNKNYRQKNTIHKSTNKSYKDQLLTTDQLTWAHTHTHINPRSQSNTGGNSVCSWNTRRWIKPKNTIRLILIRHRQNPTEINQSVWWLGYGLDDRGLIPGRERVRIFLSSPPLYPDRIWGPPGRYPTGTGVFPREVKLTTHKHLVRSYTTTPPYVLMVLCIVRHRGNTTFTLPFGGKFSLLGLNSSIQCAVNATKFSCPQ